MFLKSALRGAAVAICSLVPAVSLAEIVITDPYARVSRPGAPSGAAFMIIENTGETADRLISVRSDASQRVELHTHVDQGDGILKMAEVKEGFEIAAGASYALERGGDHVMFMGLTEPLEQGGEVTVTLVFQQAGEVTLTIPVDNERQPVHGGDQSQAHKHNHGATN